MPRIAWRALAGGDLPALAALATRCVAADGGLPVAASPVFLARRYAGDGVASLGGFDPAGVLVGAAAVRPVDGGYGAVAGQVDPASRGRGLGSHLLDWGLARAAERREVPRVETEALTPEADRLYTSRGLVRTFAEDLMRRDLAGPAALRAPPAGAVFETWTDGNAAAFFAAYQASFPDRPGFPRWPAARWIGWISDGEDFRPDCSLLARAGDGTPIGFVACAAGWIVQAGVHPDHRRAGLGGALMAAALDRLRAAGDTEALLDVNVNNPEAAALYRRLGFAVVGRRARYEPAGSAGSAGSAS